MKFIYLLLCTLLLSAAPMKGYDKLYKKVEATLTWDNVAPSQVAWQGHEKWHKVDRTKRTFKVPPPSSKSPSYQLIVLFGKTHTPQIIKTEGGKVSLKVNPVSTLSSHWLWGTTPLSRCNLSFTTAPSRSSFTLRNYGGASKKFSSLNGNFLVPIDYANALHFYSSIDPVIKVGPPFRKVTDKSLQLRCRNYHGGECPALYQFLRPEKYHVMPLKIETGRPKTPCPV